MSERELRKMIKEVIFLIVFVLVNMALVSMFYHSNKLASVEDPQLIDEVETLDWCDTRNDYDYFVIKTWLKEFITKNSSDVAKRVVFLYQETGEVKVYYENQNGNWYKFYITKDNTSKKAWKSIKALINEALYA